MSNCEKRHVCFGDLEDYIKKDFYFNNYSQSEREEIMKNLGGITKSDIYDIVKDYIESYIALTYDELY
jgi:hypothetical protein